MPVLREPDFTIRINPRIHLGLISMHANGARKNGGIGFAVNAPLGLVEFRLSERLHISDNRQSPFSDAEIQELVHIANDQSGPLKRSVEISVHGNIQSHVGMGSGTAIRMAIAEGLYHLETTQAPRKKIVARAKRGGTSGVGVNTYFSGKLIFDLGSKNDGIEFLPSSKTMRGRIPQALPPLTMPNWPLCLCIPKSIQSKTRDEEIEFFRKATPLLPEDSFQACYAALFGVYASVADADYQAFCNAIDAMQNTSWKTREWDEYGKALRELEMRLRSYGVKCVGMSSLGPMLFCFGNLDVLSAIAQDHEVLDCYVFEARPINHGRTLLSRSP